MFFIQSSCDDQFDRTEARARDFTSKDLQSNYLYYSRWDPHMDSRLTPIVLFISGMILPFEVGLDFSLREPDRSELMGRKQTDLIAAVI
jgi:hypothetical protein